MNRSQVDFDMKVLSTAGGATVYGANYRIGGVGYIGIDLTGVVNARWQEGYLYYSLQSQGVRPLITR